MSSDDRNKTVFRPSPLKKADPTANPDPKPQSGGFESDDGWGALDGSAPTSSAKATDAGASVQKATFTDTVPKPEQPREDRNALMAHAAPALALAAAVQSGRFQVPLNEFHTRAVTAIRAFEAAIDPIYSEGVRQRAKYAVCATIDDVAQNLPGTAGGGAEWAKRSMVVTFFGENIGGDRFWSFIQEMLKQPERNRDLIELFHACLAAGFEGSFRTLPDGSSRKRDVMASLFGALEHVRSLSSIDIVSHWKGLKASRKKSGFLGLLILIGSILGSIAFLIYLMLFVMLMQTGADAKASVSSIFEPEPLALNRAAPVLERPVTSTESRLRVALRNEIEVGLVEVTDNRVRTSIGALFAPASDQLQPGRRQIFERIGAAANAEPGQITIEGHTDSDGISTITYPDNFALSRARAETVARIIMTQLEDPARVKVAGMGDTVPIATNATAEGKSRNRRVEIVFEYDL